MGYWLLFITSEWHARKGGKGLIRYHETINNEKECINVSNRDSIRARSSNNFFMSCTLSHSLNFLVGNVAIYAVRIPTVFVYTRVSKKYCLPNIIISFLLEAEKYTDE